MAHAPWHLQFVLGERRSVVAGLAEAGPESTRSTGSTSSPQASSGQATPAIRFLPSPVNPRFACLVPRLLLVILLVVVAANRSPAQAPAALALKPNLVDNIERSLRYRPEGADFVIENGAEFFNRPLYGGNTAFRVDAGDRPEFSLYLPGRGGNLRLGLVAGGQAKWLHEASSISARYRPGEMLYEIRDPLLGAGVLQLAAVALSQTEGLVVRVQAAGIPSGIELIAAFGGVNGRRGSRDGDIGTERVPIGEYFQLQPEFCRDNRIEIAGSGFTLQSRAGTLAGLFPVSARLALGDAKQWDRCASLLASAGSAPASILVARMPLKSNEASFLAVQRLTDGEGMAGDLDIYREVRTNRPDAQPVRKRSLAPCYSAGEIPAVFQTAEDCFARLRARVSVETPDPWLDAAVGALNVAADAVWDEPQQALMHGAVAWRTPLLGWRGPYMLDTLGWPERARIHFSFWASRQNTSQVPPEIPSADESTNLARNEAALHSNGDLSNSHYDMNLVYIDALFRHLQWSGDLAFAREVWPVIVRHLAWERRLFRREFGAEKLPLYEAYAAIWASDDLQYNGGGTAHASAYNYFHNKMAARVARLIGEDASPYELEAGLIVRAMHQLLWIPEVGTFAEFKDYLGAQLVHPDAALWTVYHSIDSAVATPREAREMVHYVETRLPRLPVCGPGVPAGLGVYATTDWMPYTWSVNNVVFAENVHMALAFWQAGCVDDAFVLLKSSLLASMYLGVCPGNVGSMNYLDAYRRESQRDFADGGGVFSRALIEGLFGLRPDLLTGELQVAPGFPLEWTHAKLHHPQADIEFKRDGRVDEYVVRARFGRDLVLRFSVPARAADVGATLNGRPVETLLRDDRLEIRSAIGDEAKIVLTWQERPFSNGQLSDVARASCPCPKVGSDVARASCPCLKIDSGPFEPVLLTSQFNDRVTEIFRAGKYRSPRSPFASLAQPAQGIGGWAGNVNAQAPIDDTGLRAAAAPAGRFTLPNGVPFATPGPGGSPNIAFVSQWDNYPHEIRAPLAGRARRILLLMAGSTNWMQSRLDNGEVVVTYADRTTSRLALRNPETWWPIEQDYFTDDFQFRLDAPLPVRVDLKSGRVRVLDPASFKGRGGVVPGGAATVLDLALDPQKELRSLTVRALANEVVIGLMAATLQR